MAAGNHDINLEQGASFDLSLELKDPEGTPINLTGYTFKAQGRNSPSSNNVAAEFTVTALDQTTDPGKFKMSLSAAQSAKIQLSADSLSGVGHRKTSLVYDLIMTSPGGLVDRVIEGTMFVSPGSTR